MWTPAFPRLCSTSILALYVSLVTNSSASIISSSEVTLAPKSSRRKPKSFNINPSNIILFSLECIWLSPCSAYPLLGGFLLYIFIIHHFHFHIYHPLYLFGQTSGYFHSYGFPHGEFYWNQRIEPMKKYFSLTFIIFHIVHMMDECIEFNFIVFDWSTIFSYCMEIPYLLVFLFLWYVPSSKGFLKHLLSNLQWGDFHLSLFIYPP